MSDTQEIDDKKEESESTDTKTTSSKFMSFISSIVGQVIVLIIYFILASFVLYGCKVSQTNILPTDGDCSPYTNSTPTFDPPNPIDINIFPSSFFSPEFSAKISFPYSENSSNTILDMMRKYKQNPKSHYLANYLISIIEQVIIFAFNYANVVLNLLNQIPEPLIILFGPIISTFFTTILVIICAFYLMVLWFTEMKWFFKINKNTTGAKGSKPEWESVPITDIFNFWIAVWLVFIFSILFFIVFVMQGFFGVSSGILLFVIGTILNFSGKMNNEDVSLLPITADVFKYYKITIVSIITVFVILSAFGILGSVPGVFSLIVVGLVYFGILGINLYDPVNPENLTAYISNLKQPEKTCSSTTPEETKTKKWFGLFGGGSGKKLVNEIKKISNKLKK